MSPYAPASGYITCVAASDLLDQITDTPICSLYGDSSGGFELGCRNSQGDSQLLAVMAYATPVCSTLLLVGLGLESSTSLVLGAVFIVVGGLLSQANA